MQGDIAVPEHHDLVEFQYWAILPLRKELLAAKVFILGQVVYISEGEKLCQSASAENPNVSIIFPAYNYDPASNTYTICGKSGVCKAAKVLLCDVTKFVQMEVGISKSVNFPTSMNPSMRMWTLKVGCLKSMQTNMKTVTRVKKTVIHTLLKKLFRKDLEITSGERPCY